MSKVIVWVNADGSLRVTHPTCVPLSIETEDEFLDLLRPRLIARDPTLDGLAYYYVEATDLPVRVRDDGQGGTIAVRNAWRRADSTVVIDEAKV